VRRSSGLFVIGEHSNHRHERVRKFRIVSVIFVRKRNDEIAIARIRAFTKTIRDFSFDAIYDLLVERHLVVRKIDIRLQPAGVCNQGQREKDDECSEGAPVSITKERSEVSKLKRAFPATPDQHASVLRGSQVLADAPGHSSQFVRAARTMRTKSSRIIVCAQTKAYRSQAELKRS
jgi:hypothetical protein